jgi:hypothetical protein
VGLPKQLSKNKNPILSEIQVFVVVLKLRQPTQAYEQVVRQIRNSSRKAAKNTAIFAASRLCVLFF